MPSARPCGNTLFSADADPASAARCSPAWPNNCVQRLAELERPSNGSVLDDTCARSVRRHRSSRRSSASAPTRAAKAAGERERRPRGEHPALLAASTALGTALAGRTGSGPLHAGAALAALLAVFLLAHDGARHYAADAAARRSASRPSAARPRTSATSPSRPSCA